MQLKEDEEYQRKISNKSKLKLKGVNLNELQIRISRIIR
jgi:hypothetical protein